MWGSDPRTATMAWLRNLSKISTITKASQRPMTNTDPFFLLPSFTFLSHFCSNITEEKPSNKPIEYSGLEPTKPHEKPRVVVLGSGWAGCRLMKGLDTQLYDIVCVSPRNHMVFTPLLASTCVGTLEFRSVAEPIVRIQPAISKEPGSYFFLANSTGIDAHKHMVCVTLLYLFCFIICCIIFFYDNDMLYCISCTSILFHDMLYYISCENYYWIQALKREEVWFTL